MKLIRCYIENFGKLHSFSYEFNDGINIINEQNGFGKTTFATFIKSMFYGLDAGTNVKTENSERKRYMPWQGGNYGGNIEFEINGKQYKIERFFGKKITEDTFTLYDLSTNLESNDYTENIGEEIFKINKSGYERSTYIPQGKIQIEIEDSISAKLSNVLESDNDVNTSDQAIKLLNDTKKIYQKDKGKGGLIDEKKDKLYRLQRELEISKTDTEVFEAKKRKLEQKVKEINTQENSRKELDELLAKKIEQERKIAKIETYNAIKSKYKQYEEKLSELNAFLQDEQTSKLIHNNITEDSIDDAIKSCYKLPEIEKEIQLKVHEKEEIQDKIKANRMFARFFLGLGLLTCIIGIVLIFVNLQKILGFVGIAMGVALALTSFAISKKGIKNNLIEINKKIQQLEAEKNDIEIRIKEFIDTNSTDKIVDLTNLKTQLKLLNVKKEDYSNTKMQLENAEKEKHKFEIENNIADLQNIQDVSGIEEVDIKTKISYVNKKIDTLVDEKNQLKNEIEFLENKIDDNEFLEDDIEKLREEIEELEQKYKILNKAEELLTIAKQNFSTNYLNEMVEGFNKYLKIINQKDMNTNVDIKLNVKVDESGAQKEIKYFSYGYKDLVYICMRFSLINALFKDELPFVILDDPFTNLDEEKTKKALEVLNEFAKQYQLIYFVCNSSRI